jgi:hypothetical protein
MKNHLLSPTQMAALRKRFEGCKTQILALDWVTQGSLSQSPSKDPHVEKEEYHPKCALSSRHSTLGLTLG